MPVFVLHATFVMFDGPGGPWSPLVPLVPLVPFVPGGPAGPAGPRRPRAPRCFFASLRIRRLIWAGVSERAACTSPERDPRAESSASAIVAPAGTASVTDRSTYLDGLSQNM